MLVALGCGSDGPSEGEKACDDFAAKLAQCHLTNTAKCNTSEPCAVKCGLMADCRQLVERVPTGSFLACIGACSGAGPDDFLCKDGTRFVAKLGLCDGRFQCLDGSDEMNCKAQDAGGDPVDSGTMSGDGVGGTDSCRKSCEAFATCNGFPLSGCVGPSISCNGWPSTLWREEVLRAYMSCVASCPTASAGCETQAFAAAGAARAIDTAYSTACLAKKMECTMGRNNTCGEESLYVESAVAAALACLDQPCDQVDSCVDVAFGRARPE
jgi:hypothetical protein